MGSCLDMWRILQVSLRFTCSKKKFTRAISELSEPQKLLPYILQSEISNLSPDIVAVYIQAATKIFGHWTAELAQRWDDDDLREVKETIATIVSRVAELSSSPHIEVQERVCDPSIGCNRLK